MANKLVAVTDIKHDGDTIKAGTKVDPSKFSKDQLKELYDAGALTVSEDNDKDEETSGPDTSAPEEPGTTGTTNDVLAGTAPVEKTMDVPAEAKKSMPTPPAKATDTKK